MIQTIFLTKEQIKFNLIYSLVAARDRLSRSEPFAKDKKIAKKLEKIQLALGDLIFQAHELEGGKVDLSEAHVEPVNPKPCQLSQAFIRELARNT